MQSVGMSITILRLVILSVFHYYIYKALPDALRIGLVFVLLILFLVLAFKRCPCAFLLY